MTCTIAVSALRFGTDAATSFTPGIDSMSAFSPSVILSGSVDSTICAVITSVPLAPTP